jgi:hypothetical protein
MFFFEKKNQKTFAYGLRLSRGPRQHKQKSFCFFFFRKRRIFLVEVNAATGAFSDRTGFGKSSSPGG